MQEKPNFFFHLLFPFTPRNRKENFKRVPTESMAFSEKSELATVWPIRVHAVTAFQTGCSTGK